MAWYTPIPQNDPPSTFISTPLTFLRLPCCPLL